MLRGLEVETEVVLGLVERAREGRSDVLVLRGEPGIGKTPLLELAAEAAHGFRALHARGVSPNPKSRSPA